MEPGAQCMVYGESLLGKGYRLLSQNSSPTKYLHLCNSLCEGSTATPLQGLSQTLWSV